jgi:cysteinyl-tRNA synthetase
VANLVWQLPESIDSEIEISAHLEDDLNTPTALSTIDQTLDMCVKSNTAPSKKLLKQIDRLLGIKLLGIDITDEQKELITSRQQARDDKDWAQSDRLRDELKSQGIGINDTDHGQLWYRI